eukprot:m.23278 g.23278  ORF g.23278 m.23278 type:complete len:379 (-) comp7483_c0_seq2:152-1288(-)
MKAMAILIVLSSVHANIPVEKEFDLPSWYIEFPSQSLYKSVWKVDDELTLSSLEMSFGLAGDQETGVKCSGYRLQLKQGNTTKWMTIADLRAHRPKSKTTVGLLEPYRGTKLFPGDEFRCSTYASFPACTFTSQNVKLKLNMFRIISSTTSSATTSSMTSTLTTISTTTTSTTVSSSTATTTTSTITTSTRSSTITSTSSSVTSSSVSTTTSSVTSSSTTGTTTTSTISTTSKTSTTFTQSTRTVTVDSEGRLKGASAKNDDKEDTSIVLSLVAAVVVALIIAVIMIAIIVIKTRRKARDPDNFIGKRVNWDSGVYENAAFTRHSDVSITSSRDPRYVNDVENVSNHNQKMVFENWNEEDDGGSDDDDDNDDDDDFFV